MEGGAGHLPALGRLSGQLLPLDGEAPRRRRSRCLPRGQGELRSHWCSAHQGIDGCAALTAALCLALCPFYGHLFLCCRLLATCSADQTCKIWKTSNFSLMTELSIKSNNPGETSRGWMWDCAFSGDSQYIVTGE